MCASLKIVNPPAGSKRAGQGPDVNGLCHVGPSNTADKRAGTGQSFNRQARLSLKI